MQSGVATLSYRRLEAARQYAEAREEVREQLGVARRRRAARTEAVLTNNLGCEYIPEGDFAAAQPYFEKAEAIFWPIGPATEVANVHTNGLICRFERLGVDEAASLRREIEAALAVLEKRSDWRRRATF